MDEQKDCTFQEIAHLANSYYPCLGWNKLFLINNAINCWMQPYYNNPTLSLYLAGYRIRDFLNNHKIDFNRHRIVNGVIL